MKALLRKLLGPSKRELRAEIERLTNLMSDPKLIDLELEPGGALRMGLEVGIGAKILAASFADLLGDAKNWRAVHVGPMPGDNGMILVTVKREYGDSPEASYSKACDLLEALIEPAQHCAWETHSATCQAAIDRAREFLGIRSEEKTSTV
jgi:hypothetical protein